MNKKQKLRDLITKNIKSNSNRIDPNKTTGPMLRQVLLEMVNALDDEETSSGDARYHTKVYGEIKLFWGNYFSLPKGWVICDGYNGTPDLRGKVPVGWSNGWQSSPGEVDLSEYQHIGRMGGSKKIILEPENLPNYTLPITGVTNSSGSHTHTFTDNGSVNDSGAGTAVAGTAGSQSLSSLTMSSSGAHTHTVTGTTGPLGEGVELENRQPYMVVMYIMYVGDSIISSQDKVTWSEYDSTTGAITKLGDSNSKYGFRYIAPAIFSSIDPDNYETNQTSEIISNLGFIPEGDPARSLEKWLQIVSSGDNLGNDDQTI